MGKTVKNEVFGQWVVIREGYTLTDLIKVFHVIMRGLMKTPALEGSDELSVGIMVTRGRSCPWTKWLEYDDPVKRLDWSKEIEHG